MATWRSPAGPDGDPDDGELRAGGEAAGPGILAYSELPGDRPSYADAQDDAQR